MKIRFVWTAFNLLAGFIGAACFYMVFKPSVNFPTNTINIPFTQANHSSNPPIASGDFTYASAVSTPAVVYITTASQQRSYNWFDWYFNGNGSETVVGSGSGVIYSKDGYIITNQHVIKGAEKIEVTHLKKTYEAKLIGTDPSSDLAVLKIDAEQLPSIPFGSSAAVKTGEWVLAVGNPFNLTSTVTAGIVSAKGRNIHIVNSQFPIESFIQTDAAINPGNSGGALVNTKGELIGINTAILSKTGSYTGYGFAVPSDIVFKIVNDIIKYGTVQKAFFGADVAELNSTVAKQLNHSELNGVYIATLQKEGAAYDAGLSINDIIIQCDALPIMNQSDFDEYIAYKRPGDKIKITYIRNGEKRETTVTLTNEDGDYNIIKKEFYTSNSLGADLELVPKVERLKLGINNGVRIVKIKQGLITRLGLQEGTIITAINRNEIKTPQELEDIMTKLRGRIILECVQTNGSKMVYQYYY
jgi:serine protease Do